MKHIVKESIQEHKTKVNNAILEKNQLTIMIM